MRTWWIEIAAVTCAARLAGVELTDNYAIFGAMGRYRNISLGAIREAEGIDDVPQKAKSFEFGVRCGKALERYLPRLDDNTALIYEAQIARSFFVSLDDMGDVPPDERKKTLTALFEAFVKRAQIRTHTAKPGYEDIGSWLECYYELQQGYLSSLPVLVEAIVSPDAGDMEKASGFLSGRDPLVKLALQKTPPDPKALSDAMTEAPCSLFGKILREVIYENH